METHIYFGSELQSNENREMIDRLSPCSGKTVSKYPFSSVEDAKKALKIAKSSLKEAKKTPLSQRINWLLDVANKLEANRDFFAKIITDEVGKPLMFSKIEVDRCVETIRVTASEALSFNGELFNSDAMPSGKKTISYFKHEPVGVVVAITPFNFPLNLVAHKLAPALVLANAVILKPTREAPRIAFEFAKLFIESDFAPKDVLTILYGGADVATELISSPIPRVVSFTGSVPVGEQITKNAGIKKVSLELGGNAGTYIDKSADLKLSAKRCVFGAFVNSGQVCISLQRLYIHSDVYDEFASYMKEECEKLTVGDPYDDNTFIGPMINEKAKAKAKVWLDNAKEEGAKVLSGDKFDGLIMYPTVMVDVTRDMSIVCEEVFAPIVSLVAVDSFDEALNELNDSDYGLQSSIFTNDLKQSQRAIEEFDAGGVVVNDIPTLRFDIQPYGGVKNSGVGREGPRFALEEFSEIKSVVIC